MGKKIRAAKASLVAAFLAASGAATAKAMHGTPSAARNLTGGRVSVDWGDPLVRFLKLDGMPAYLKADGFEALTQFYKLQILDDASTLYIKEGQKVSDVLSYYQKGDEFLPGIVDGLEQFYKENNLDPLLEYIKENPGALDAYIKYDGFIEALQSVARDDAAAGGSSALDFYVKMTGIDVGLDGQLPAVQDTTAPS